MHSPSFLIMLFLLLVSLFIRSGKVDAFIAPAQLCRCVDGKPPAIISSSSSSSSLRLFNTKTVPESPRPPSEGTAGNRATILPKSNKEIRPLTQNWWPVSLISTLHKSKPNSIELLDEKLVLWFDASAAGGEDEGRWSCLDDRCAHRCAPLSEGRIVHDATPSGSSCLQCAYHGWEFDDAGGCNRIPQASDERAKSGKLCSVRSHPIRECAGMIWVWPDSNVPPTEEDREPKYQISNLLKRFHEAGGTARGFQRDLPYGMEFLGENLADVSHLPFSHHSVGALNRGDGRPVPLEMLSEAEKTETARSRSDPVKKLPLYQVRVANAAEHDPEIVAALKYNPVVQSQADPKLASCSIGFHDPCHIRYNRNQGIPGASYEVNLFMCPTTQGNSRVFLFVPYEKMLPKIEEGDKDLNESAINQSPARSTMLNTATLKKMRFLSFFARKKTNSFPPHLGHMISHRIFDGDGIFLNKQGDRMRRAKLTTKDYHTPTSADILVNAFRRWLRTAADATRAAGEERAAGAAAGDGEDVYTDDRPRAELLDRYASHTADCGICQAALKSLKGERERMSLLSTALVGATGASGAILACTIVLSLLASISVRGSSSRGVLFKVAFSVMVSSAMSTVASLQGIKETRKRRANLDKEIQQFYFEDYVHAEKD